MLSSVKGTPNLAYLLATGVVTARTYLFWSCSPSHLRCCETIQGDSVYITATLCWRETLKQRHQCIPECEQMMVFELEISEVVGFCPYQAGSCQCG